MSEEHILITNGTVEMRTSRPFTLNANEKTIVDEMMLGLFGTVANQGTPEIAFAERTNPNSNNPFVDAIVTADTPINPCFVAGTLILTPRGDVPVKTLSPGDNAITHGRR
ncbi:Hint domain-containing protein [Acidocella aminolytica]|uniref:Hedgehog/Intein (Hint) domain-containing protein n=1 Tax=Acidocella aminolytica 101 = DSM 11237 TaxID=1120923 RepID=A0A0D6PER2_9PROT|nr:Hint domain-containing protein [Acidocella aminolytica]GAN80240.1 hypothetical protein Aam_041_007 [Acidocella aminolytica 101 = DSM 11237]GBQ44601.1 hypothetical protein AA11237_3543 [Acidocella aminolytica 101 = DSM 11237]SHE92421.1 Hint domain-containing protein [Acidocella aminolytica 101 = DSM 11237]